MGRSWSMCPNHPPQIHPIPSELELQALSKIAFFNLTLLRYLNSCDSWGRSPVHAAATTESSMCLRILVQVLALASIS